MKSSCHDSKCPKYRSLRTNLFEAQKLVNTRDECQSDAIDKRGVNSRYCFVCEDLKAATNNMIFKSIKRNTKKVRFTKVEINILVRLYLVLTGGRMKKELPISDFKQFLISSLGIFDTFALDGICRSVKINSRGKTISVDEFLQVLSILLRGTLSERIEFGFKVMDFDSDTFIRKHNEISNLLVGSFNPEIAALNPDLDAEEPERDTVNYLHQRLMNANPIISQEDFKEKVLLEPLLLECLISFLPSPETSSSFQEALFAQSDVNDQWLSDLPDMFAKKVNPEG